MIDHNSFPFIRSLSADEVFSQWRDGEMHLPRWIEHYKNAGFDSWDAWREHTIKDLHFKDLAWKLYRIENPTLIVPSFLGGPFRTWMDKYYNGAEAITFSELIKNKTLQENPIVQGIFRDFPKETHLIGFITEQGVMIIEGMHRCCAVALAAAEGQPIQTELFISLAEYRGPVPHLGQPNSPI
jgi:hypothetical protein